MDLDKETDKISDVAKTFRNLRSQLMNQNRSRTKLDLNKIRSQKNSDQIVRKEPLQGMSRNLGEHKMNTLSPKLSPQKVPMFERKIREGSSPNDFGISRLGSATTLYMETVSNKNYEARNEESLTNNTLEEEKNFSKPPGYDQITPIIASNNFQIIDRSLKNSSLLQDDQSPFVENLKSNITKKVKPKKKLKGAKKFKPKKRGFKERSSRAKPHPDFLYCDNEEIIENMGHPTSQLIMRHNPQPPSQYPTTFNPRHNLSKVEEEDADDTYYEMQV